MAGAATLNGVIKENSLKGDIWETQSWRNDGDAWAVFSQQSNQTCKGLEGWLVCPQRPSGWSRREAAVGRNVRRGGGGAWTLEPWGPLAFTECKGSCRGQNFQQNTDMAWPALYFTRIILACLVEKRWQVKKSQSAQLGDFQCCKGELAFWICVIEMEGMREILDITRS